MKIIIMGPPGSGKGTQTNLLGNFLKIDIISVGDILRNEVSNKTEIGLKIKSIIENGLLIDDNITFSLVKNRLLFNKSFILDGMPRTLNQSLFFEKMNINFDFLINIKVKSFVLIKRIKYRLINEKFNGIYNIIYNRPKIKNFDDFSGDVLFLRKDDVYNIFIKRLEIYEKNLKDILNFYIKKNNIKIFDIKGDDNINDVFLKIKSCIYEKKIY